MLRDFVLFREKLLDAFEEIIDAWDLHKDYLEGFYAAYDTRRSFSWLVEAQEGLRGAVKILFAYTDAVAPGKISDPTIMKLVPPPSFGNELFATLEALLQGKPRLLEYIANSLRNLQPPIDPDSVGVAELKKILLNCLEVYAVRTSYGLGILPNLLG